MNKAETTLLYSYCMNVINQYENEEISLMNHIRFTRADSIDILALASAKHDTELVKHICGQVLELLKIEEKQK